MAKAISTTFPSRNLRDLLSSRFCSENIRLKPHPSKQFNPPLVWRHLCGGFIEQPVYRESFLTDLEVQGTMTALQVLASIILASLFFEISFNLFLNDSSNHWQFLPFYKESRLLPSHWSPQATFKGFYLLCQALEAMRGNKKELAFSWGEGKASL